MATSQRPADWDSTPQTLRGLVGQLAIKLANLEREVHRQKNMIADHEQRITNLETAYEIKIDEQEETTTDSSATYDEREPLARVYDSDRPKLAERIRTTTPEHWPALLAQLRNTSMIRRLRRSGMSAAEIEDQLGRMGVTLTARERAAADGREI